MKYLVSIKEFAENGYYPETFTVTITDKISWTSACPAVCDIRGCHKIWFKNIFRQLEDSSASSLSGIAHCECKDCNGVIHYTVSKL